MNKENLLQIGVLLIIVGSFFISLFFLSNEEIHFMSDLIPYTAGFLITGIIASFFGFIFTIICLDQYEESGAKGGNTTKIRVVLIIVTAIFLILIGYLMYVNEEWEIKSLIIEEFDQIFAFYPTFILKSNDIMFATLATFGLFVLPFVINELGLLDDYPDEQLEDLGEEGQTIEKTEDQLDKFARFLKRQFGILKKIKNYTLPIGITLTVFGSCFIGLPYFFLIDSQIPDPEAEEWFREVYYGLIRGQLFLIGILILVIGLILIIQYKRRRPNSEKKTETS